MQLSVKVDDAVSGPVVADPEIGRVPDQAPLALQLVALVADQDRVAASPESNSAGFVVNVRVGTGAADT